ncbi:MAG: acyl--CoA ligase [Bdellovibrionaceae bacterium]|nr:acyl--CoA ligase [Pseudobdellovibrionaceae bacterium]
MTVFLWKGYHNKHLSERIAYVWDNTQCMIFLPPALQDFSFVSYLPTGPIECLGEWTSEELDSVRSQYRSDNLFPESPVFGLFTSGTSGGKQKLVFYSKRNIEFSLNGVLDFFEPDKIKHVFCYPHPFHTFGLLLGYVNAHIHNWTLTPLDHRYSSAFHEEWLHSATENTLTLGTPTHFKDLQKFLATRDITPPKTYSCIVGGAPVSPELWESLQKDLNIQKPSLGYGATEASPALTHLTAGVPPFTTGHIGWPLKGVTITAQPNGGFSFTGPNVCLAYLHNDQLVFPDSIFLNDELQKNSDGSYTFLGRTDFMLNRGGEKFLLEDIEAFLLHKFSLHTLAIAISDPRLGEDLGLLMEIPEKASAPSTEEIQMALSVKYKTHFSNHLFFYVPQFPVTESGKLHRKESSRILNELQRASTQ